MDSKLDRETIKSLYASFDAPVTDVDCGKKCAPHNEYGIPFCCDIKQTVPTAYQAEWVYLQASTNLWQPWVGDDEKDAALLRQQTPEGMKLIQCLGHRHCQREYRSIVCRSFPFFPYLTRAGELIGLSYYWEYEDRCWVISNLDRVTSAYRNQFIQAYDTICSHLAQERENFHYFSELMRQTFREGGRKITLLHRNGEAYRISPEEEGLAPVRAGDLPKFGVYEIAANLPFADEE